MSGKEHHSSALRRFSQPLRCLAEFLPLTTIGIPAAVIEPRAAGSNGLGFRPPCRNAGGSIAWRRQGTPKGVS
jgi:hypothetical protein